MYHVELRKFPHNRCCFNLNERELMAVIVPWARGEWVRLGERSFNAHDSRLTIIEGPQLAAAELTMGRGWRTAQRRGADVTRQLLERVKARQGASPAGQREPAATAEGGAVRQASRTEARADAADDTARRQELGTLLGGDPEPLLEAWRRARAALPDRPPSESLAAAEAELARMRAAEAARSSG